MVPPASSLPYAATRYRVPSGRATYLQSTASQGRAGGWAEERGRACLGLDRRATLGQPHGGRVFSLSPLVSSRCYEP